MPSVLDTAKEATYAAVGLQLLAIDEMNEVLPVMKNFVI